MNDVCKFSVQTENEKQKNRNADIGAHGLKQYFGGIKKEVFFKERAFL